MRSNLLNGLFSFLVVILVLFTSCKENHNKISDNLLQNKAVGLSQNKFVQLSQKLTDPDYKGIMVIAHRGDWRNAPENSLQAIENCIKMGIDMVEIDVGLTKDGHLVLMHDDEIDRTTTGKGKLSDWTLDSLRTLFLRNGANHATHHKIPTLEEAMLVAKGRILVNLDKCYDNFDKAYEVLQKTGTVDHVVMKGKVPLQQVKKEFGTYLNKVHFMPVVNLGDPNAEEIILDYRRSFKPIAYELVFRNEDSSILEKLEDIKMDGSKIWVNSLWKSLNAGYEDDMAVINRDSIYGWYVNKGINMIQTDRPQLLLDYLRGRNLHD